MKHLLIENKGELPEAALLLMGASTKRSDSSKIGMFGTGAKYAVATLLREGIKIEIHTTDSGDWSPAVDCMAKADVKRYRFRADPVQLKDQTFHQISLLRDNERKGSPLNFTTEMGGLNWSVEAGLRELISNAYDEEEANVERVDEYVSPSARLGYTRVYVQLTRPVAAFWQEFDRWFTKRRVPQHTGDGWRLYLPLGPGVRVYRKGVLVYEGEENAAWDYDLDHVDVNEERKAGSWECRYQIARLLKDFPPPALTRILKSAGKRDSFEYRIDPSYTQSWDGWKELLGETVLVEPVQATFFVQELRHFEHMVLPHDWVVALKGNDCRGLEDVISATRLKGYEVVEELTRAEEFRLSEAMSFLEAVGSPVDRDRVQVIQCEEGGVLGEYLEKDKLICIHRNVLNGTLAETVKVLFHERMHEVSGAADYDRRFADGIVDAWMMLAQEKIGRWL